MIFKPRDGQIIYSIDRLGGVLARRHLKELFWPAATWRAMEKVLARLKLGEHLVFPTREQWRARPIPESIVWLGWKGALYIGSLAGATVPEPTKINENQLRRLQESLRRQGIRWLREPDWSQLQHDLAVVDVRLAVERAVAQSPFLTLEEWIPENVFRADTDTVTFQYKTRNGNLKKGKRGVIPDGFCVLGDTRLQAQGKPHQARMLWEIDFATHAHTKWGRDKVAAGLAYLGSRQYRQRFGGEKGHWLVVINAGEDRLEGLRKTTQRMAVDDQAKFFFFTTMDRLEGANILTDPIWLRGDRRERDGDERESLIG